MRSLLIAFAAITVASAPANAETTPTTADGTEVKAKTVKRIVCKRVDTELGTGSRLGTPGKICKEVEVVAPDTDKGGSDKRGSNRG